MSLLGRFRRIFDLYKLRRCFSTVTEYNYLDGLDGPHNGPSIHTAVPGPQSLKCYKDLDQVQLTNTIQIFTNYYASFGNYMVDADNNVFLDVFQQIGSLPLGYNNPAVLKAVSSDKNLSLLASRPALGFAPTIDYFEQLQNSLLSIKPAGMNHLVQLMCGTCSNENALKLAYMWYMKNKRGGGSITDVELKSASNNKPPGSPNITTLSFRGSFHGRTIGCLSITHSKAINKVDIPTLDGPIAPFPVLRYPLEEFVEENKAEEKSCLEQTEDLILQYESKSPVAAVIVEPIQSEGGDNHASHEFFRGLQQICFKYGCAFIVDEVQTGGGGTGHFWAHEAWGLPSPPHLVTLSKKLQTGGIFAIDGMLPTESYRIYNTWMGDACKLPILKATVNEINEHNLLELVKESGELLLNGLKQIETQYQSVMHSARGVGTYCAFNFRDSNIRDKVLHELRNKGIMIAPCGNTCIRMRPALIFQPKHVNMFLNILETVVKEI